ncbi:MAG: DUF2341 domain-containing protein [Kiritimatiellae bacterium]|nr:DUF2341 domain-containing protein [Kiritimatiellia bacterium]
MKKIIACFCRGGGNPLNYLCAVLLALALAPSAFGAPQYKAALTVQGYSGSSTLEDFPVLVRLSPQTIDGFSYSACAQNGSDISFVAADGKTLLPYDIDTWDETGTSLIWVKVPEVASSGTSFTIRWGDDEPPANTPADTWSGYKSVWHMDIANGATADIRVGYAATVLNPNQYCGAGTGIVGGAYHNEQNKDASHCVKTPDVAGFSATTEGVATFSLWVRQIGGTKSQGSPDEANYPQILWGSTWGNCGTAISTKNGNTDKGKGICIDLEGKAAQYNTMVVRDDDFTTMPITLESIYDKQWHHLVLAYDATGRRFYVDGVLQRNFSSSVRKYTNPSAGWTMRFGGRSDTTTDCVWTGDLDEIRFFDGSLSADRVAAEYANVADAAFLAYGTAQAGNGTVRVNGAPVEAGTPIPAYGFNSGYAADAPVSFSMAATEVPGEGTVTNYLAGWRFESVNTETQARTTIASSDDPGAAIGSYTGTYAGYSEFTWLWDVRDALGLGSLSAAVNRGTSIDLAVEVTGLGYAANASATLTVAYGLAANDLDKTATATVTARGTAIVKIPRLQPGVPYFFKATLDNGADEPAVSEIVSFATSLLTTGRRRIEFVEGAGQQFIDTHYMPTPTTRALVDFQFTEKAASRAVFGLNIGNLSYSFLSNGQANWIYALANDRTTKVLTPTTAIDTERNLIDFNHPDGENRAISVYGPDGAVKVTQSPVENTATQNATATLILGAQRKAIDDNSQTSFEYTSKYRLYSARFYEGGNLAFALVPVISDSGSVSFYDTVHKDFFANSMPGADIPGYTTGGPTVSASLAVENDERVIALTFLAAPMDRPLRIAYGPEFAGDDPADWATTEAVATVPAGATSATVPLPATWGDDNAYVARCYFDDGTSFPLWSDAIVWSDASSPILDNIAADGTGGDTLVVSGTLVNFPGDDCTLTVYTGASADSLTETWSELPGSVMTEAGNFSLTLYESDTTSSRYIEPGSSMFVSIQASCGGKVARTPVISVQTKGAPVFGATSNNDLNNITFTGNLSDLGAGGSAVVTLYVGTANNADSLEAVETPKKITGTGNFTFTHAFPELDKTYYWQFRAVSTTAGGTPLETRTGVKSCRQNEKATYTWKADGNGNWNGDWEDPAHWSANMSPNKGYPQSSGSIAQFANCTLEHPVTVNVNDKYTLSRLRFWGSDNGSKIVFVGTGRDTSGFTSGYDQSAVASNTEVEFRDMTLNASGNWEVLRNTAKTNVTFRVVRSKVAVGLYFALSANTCRLEVLGGSEFIAPGKLNMGGRGTVMVVDDSTVTAASTSMGIIFNADTSEKGEIEVRLRGRNAKINAGSFYTYAATSGQFGARVILEVPKEGFASAPIEMTSTKKFCEGHTIAGKKIIFEVDAKSPALVKSNRLLENMVVLDSTTPGGIASGAVTEDIGVVPSRNGKSSGAFKFDDTASPKKILLDLQGWMGGFILSLY